MVQGNIQTTGTFNTGILITFSKACESNEEVLQGGRLVKALVNIGLCHGEERNLKEVSHSQQPIIKDRGSFFREGKGEAHLIKTAML